MNQDQRELDELQKRIEWQRVRYEREETQAYGIEP